MPNLLEEYGGLADERLERRLRRMVTQLAVDPGRSFPRAFGTIANVEAGYRFLRNPRVSPRRIMGPHVEQTWQRAKGPKTVLAISDTTEVRFGGHAKREGLGTLMNDGQGFFLHAALLVAMDEHPMPLGVAAYEVMVRDASDSRRKKALSHMALLTDPNNELLRWNRVASAVAEGAATNGISVVHVADREADRYTLLSELLAQEQRFVIRMRFDRRTSDDNEWISEQVSRAPTVFEREVTLSARVKLGDGRRKNKRPRSSRSARLSVRATSVVIPRDRHYKNVLDELCVNVVDVIELEPPAGADAVQWTLLTTEPISTPSEVERVVDIYRARWLIEEYWKALKTGCSYEDRQLESRHTLENALAIFLPLAWNMLRLRTVARSSPTAPAAHALSGRLLELLMAAASVSSNPWGVRLTPTPSADEVLRAVARMGGHLPQNGDPGWIVIRRGFDELFALQRAADLLDLLPPAQK